MYQMSNMVIVNSVTDFQQKAPTIAAAPDGTLLVAWQDTRFSWEPGAAALGWEITSQLLHPDLTSSGAEIVVTRSDKDQTTPKVVAKPDGSFVLAFADGNPPFDIVLPVDGGLPQTQENDAVAVVTLTATPVAGQLTYGTAWNPPAYVNLPGYSYNHSHIVTLESVRL